MCWILQHTGSTKTPKLALYTFQYQHYSVENLPGNVEHIPSAYLDQQTRCAEMCKVSICKNQGEKQANIWCQCLPRHWPNDLNVEPGFFFIFFKKAS